MSLVGGFRYVQSDDPGAVGAGMEWLDSASQRLYMRNTYNSGWTLVGLTEVPNLGDLQLGGGAVTGALVNTSYATNNSPDLQGTAKATNYQGLNSKYIASTLDISNMMKTLRNEFTNTISSSIVNALSSSVTLQNLAVGTGTQSISQSFLSFTIPLPFYYNSDHTLSGRQALDSEVLFHVAWLMQSSHSDRGAAPSVYVQSRVYVTSGRSYQIDSTNLQGGDSVDTIVGYLIIAVK